jgi:2,3-bisphosphoglycerate-dependent phosphoglycerate mutase
VLYFVRHGETDWNCEPTRCQGWADVPLNAAGRRQAREQGARLRSAGIQTIVSSHLRRAAETAELIREQLGGDLPLRLDERLAETRRGRWEDRTFAEIMAEEPKEWRCYRERPQDFRFPEGESLVEQQRRVLAAVRDVAADGRVALVVTHGGSIRLLRAFLDGAGVQAFHTMKAADGDLLQVPCDGLAGRIDAFLAAQPTTTASGPA